MVIKQVEQNSTRRSVIVTGNICHMYKARRDDRSHRTEEHAGATIHGNSASVTLLLSTKLRFHQHTENMDGPRVPP
jgi:hypothetical protein